MKPGKSGIWIHLLLPALFLLSSCSYTFYQASCNYSVAGNFDRQGFLTDTLLETSGIETADSLFVSFNDSGGDPALYYISAKGAWINSIRIPGISNADWEDIAADSQFYYIADVGNNYGTRDTLVIYRVPADQDGYSGDMDVNRISFSYNEPSAHKKNGLYSHDCEALFAYGDSLYLFSKDWVNLSTRVYVLPKAPGHYQVSARTSYQVGALITGADIDPRRKEVVLVGYRNFIPVVIRYGFTDDPAMIQCGGRARKYPWKAGLQTEGVCFDDQERIVVTSEKSLYRQSVYIVN